MNFFVKLTESRARSFTIFGILILLFFGQTLWFDFAYDDFLHISYNELVTASDSTWGRILTSPTYPGDLYRPIPTISYRLTHNLFGLTPAAYHAINVVLYFLICCLVWQLSKLVFGAKVFAFFTTLLFVVHPIHIEPVVNVSGRTELLAALLGLGALLLSYRSFEAQGLGSFFRNAIGAVLLFFFAVLSKESALTLLPVVPLFLYIVVKRRGGVYERQRIIALFSFFGVAVGAYFLCRYLVLEDKFLVTGLLGHYHPENPLLGVPFEGRLYASFVYLGRYLAFLIVPVGLSVDYSLPYASFWDGVYSLKGIGFALLFVEYIALVVWARKRLASLFFGLFSLLTFAVTANAFVPIGTIMGDRLAFLPSIGFGGFLVSELIVLRKSVPKLARILPIFYGSLICLCMVVTFLRTPIWQNNKTLFTRAVKDNPRSTKAALALAVHYYHWEKDPEKAETFFRKAFEIDPSVTQAARYMIDISIERKNIGQAEYWCRQVLRFEPEDPVVTEKLTEILKVKDALRKDAS